MGAVAIDLHDYPVSNLTRRLSATVYTFCNTIWRSGKNFPLQFFLKRNAKLVGSLAAHERILFNNRRTLYQFA